MRNGHSAKFCHLRRAPQQRNMEPGPDPMRPCSSSAFLPTRPPQLGHPSLSVCVALVEAVGQQPANFIDALSRGLAARFEGSFSDYKVASFRNPSFAIFFPNWVARESTIGRSPISLYAITFRFSNWVETGEKERGHLQHKAWIKLHHWPILCWNEEDVKAAISGFGALWEVDSRSENWLEVSFFRVLIRCQNVGLIHEVLDSWWTTAIF